MTTLARDTMQQRSSGVFGALGSTEILRRISGLGQPGEKQPASQRRGAKRVMQWTRGESNPGLGTKYCLTTLHS
jgi:hypothetical protein